MTQNNDCTEIVESGVRLRMFDDTDGGWSMRDVKRKPRIHIWGEPEPDLPRPEYTVRGENPENDKAWDRYNRAELKIMRTYVKYALGLIGLKDAKFHYSRYAGCSCPCSPGFILDSHDNKSIPHRLGKRTTFIGIDVTDADGNAVFSWNGEQGVPDQKLIEQLFDSGDPAMPAIVGQSGDLLAALRGKED